MFDLKIYDVDGNEKETIRGLNTTQIVSIEMMLFRLGIKYKIIRNKGE